ncbi:MAG: helix-turn-helix domain-containing protein [Pseudomonadota bacterium]
MIVRKLRLQRGWSQEQLSALSGISVRTIQRVERGAMPSLETAKSLAAVFEVDQQSLRTGATNMSSQSESSSTLDKPVIADDEKLALQYVKGLKEFYSHAGMYAIFLVSFLALGRFTDPKLVWGFVGWGVGVILHALVAYEVIGLFSAGWEKRLVEKRLGRKL